MVAVGLTLMEPVADVEVNVPGVMAMLAAPDVVQLRVLLAPELIPVGLAANEAIVGSDPWVEDEFDVAPQLIRTKQTKRIAVSRQIRETVALRMTESRFPV